MSSSLLVSENLYFDASLALFHAADSWLAIADLHYGYELSQRAAGALFPSWGMHKIEERVFRLIDRYQPQTVLFLGDLVHNSAARQAFAKWVAHLEETVPALVLLRGNHDRQLKQLAVHDHWRIGSSFFHHGDRPVPSGPEDVLFSGHLHPARTISDGAGCHQRLPALCRTAQGWILPAFSPWAAGGTPQTVEILDHWVTNQAKIWKLN